MWNASARSIDPLAVIRSMEARRLPELLPLRYERMSRSPFAYFRGVAAVNAADVACCPVTGIVSQACGDCHPGNFGMFASPERRLLFDIIDFDETLQASWEFDVKRLAAGFVLLARGQGRSRSDEREVVETLVRSYREHLAEYARMSPLDVWYASLDSKTIIEGADDDETRSQLADFERVARQHTADKLIQKMVVSGDDGPVFRDEPPALTRLLPDSPAGAAFRAAFARYPATLAEERRFLLSRYRLCDVAFKVVGIGSVGTRCGVGLFMSAAGEPLFLQIKEACPSVLRDHVAAAAIENEGRRVALGQRTMQSASDMFLGWASDDEGRHYSIRQLRDMRKSIPEELLGGALLGHFAGMCGWALARAHAKGGNAAMLTGYFGSGEHIDKALAAFAAAYADQCELDFDRFRQAIARGEFRGEHE